MELFDKIGKKASETYKYTTEKTGKIAKEAKIKMAMNNNKAKIEEIYEQIGKKVFEKHVREENINIKDDLAEECSKIDKLAEEIEKYRTELLGLNDKKQCKKCYSEIELDYKFCPNCGEKQDEPEKTNNQEETNEPEKEEEIIIENFEEFEENNK